MSEYDQMTLEQLRELEQWMYDQDAWMYDQDALEGENYYDERMKLLQYIETRTDK